MSKSDSQSARRQPRLGRGLSSLMTAPLQPTPKAGGSESGKPHGTMSQANGNAGNAQELVYLAVDSIVPNLNQPRKVFDEVALKSLADSIQIAGVMQPVIVRPGPEGHVFELVAGERRWRAAQMANLDRLPALVQNLGDQEVAEWSLVENLQRADLNPMERAQAFQNLIEQFQLSHEQIGQRVGIDRSTITNTLRLLNLDQQVQDIIRQGLLSTSQAKVLLSIDDLHHQRLIARRAVTNDWSVRRIEHEVRSGKEIDPAKGNKQVKSRHSHLADLERQISEQLGTKVRVRPGRKKGAGMLSIEFYDLDQFDALLERFQVETN